MNLGHALVTYLRQQKIGGVLVPDGLVHRTKSGSILFFKSNTQGGVVDVSAELLRLFPATPYTRKRLKTMVPAARLGQSQRQWGAEQAFI